MVLTDAAQLVRLDASRRRLPSAASLSCARGEINGGLKPIPAGAELDGCLRTREF